MSESNQSLQNEFLNLLRKNRTPVSVFLTNGVRLGGHIQSFDLYSIRLQSEAPQLILKRVIATVVPEKFVRTGKGFEGAQPRMVRSKPGGRP